MRLITLIFLLAGCHFESTSDVDRRDVVAAEEVCLEHGGWINLKNDIFIGKYAVCSDGEHLGYEREWVTGNRCRRCGVVK